jgi:hypothetical protein
LGFGPRPGLRQSGPRGVGGGRLGDQR